MPCHLSVISPVYRAEGSLTNLLNKLRLELKSLTPDYEIILVEDASPDKSWQCIKNESESDARIKGIKLSRNFGQHYAITAGLDHAIGDWIIVMDCDLQDDPAEIPKLYKKAMEGHKVVLAQRENRSDAYAKKISSLFFYRILSLLTGVKQDASVANFGIYHRDVIKAINSMREPFRNFSAIVNWVGFSPTKVPVRHSERPEGRSGYSFRKLLKLAADTILAYSNRPLYFIVFLGMIISALSLGAGAYFLIRYLSGGINVEGYTSLIISISVLSGFLIMSMGVVGLYVGKTFEGIKERPLYIIDEVLNF